jgi:hypothetical protein
MNKKDVVTSKPAAKKPKPELSKALRDNLKRRKQAEQSKKAGTA